MNVLKANNSETVNQVLSIGDEVILRDDTKKKPDIGKVIAKSFTTKNVYRVQWPDHISIPKSLWKFYKNNSESVIPKNTAWHHIDHLRPYVEYKAELKAKQKAEEEQRTQHQKIKKGLINWLKS